MDQRTQGTCTHVDADGARCPKPLRSPGATWCAMHYHRWYRHGSPDKTEATSGVRSGRAPHGGRRYRLIYRPGHPLATANGNVYVHRAVLYEAIGPGRHKCHWCPAMVTWDATRGDPDVLCVDHLNDDGDDNRAENLAPSCWRCNTTRGTQKRHRALVAAGFWSNHDTIERLRSGGRQPDVEVACDDDEADAT